MNANGNRFTGSAPTSPIQLLSPVSLLESCPPLSGGSTDPQPPRFTLVVVPTNSTERNKRKANT